MLNKIKRIFSQKARQKRAKIFIKYLKPQRQDKILDLGGGDGSHINMILDGKIENYDITVADILENDLKQARDNYNFKTVQLNEEIILPFSDKEFDIVFCNSVIEHVTIPKELIWKMKNKKKFEQDSFIRQKRFSEEIRRISKSYYVQTPNKYFLIESHSWLPIFIVFLPRSVQIQLIKIFNMFWFKKTTPDWNLLTKTNMEDLFFDANILTEKSFGMRKSFIACRKS